MSADQAGWHLVTRHACSLSTPQPLQEHEPLDPAHWLAHHPCVYLTPHIAGVTETSCEWRRHAQQACSLGQRGGGGRQRRPCRSAAL